MIKNNNENKESKEYWVDDDLNPVFDDEFKQSIDDHENFEMTINILYSAYVEKNYSITDEDLSRIKVHYSSMKDFDKLLNISRILDKNKDKYEVLESLYKEDKDPDVLRKKLFNIYDDTYNVGKFINTHVDIDLKKFLDSKSRYDKLDSLLNGQ